VGDQGGSAGGGGAPSDAGILDARGDAGACAAAGSARACVSCCQSLYPMSSFNLVFSLDCDSCPACNSCPSDTGACLQCLNPKIGPSAREWNF
jgi:hypothetical protein